MQRIIRYSIEDVIVDADGVVDALNHACAGRTGMYKVRGLCQVGDDVYFVLLPLGPQETLETYVLAPVEDVSTDGFSAMLHTRWTSGFDTVGAISLGDSVYVLFARPQTE